jgi:hypothetical protein
MRGYLCVFGALDGAWASRNCTGGLCDTFSVKHCRTYYSWNDVKFAQESSRIFQACSLQFWNIEKNALNSNYWTSELFEARWKGCCCNNWCSVSRGIRCSSAFLTVENNKNLTRLSNSCAMYTSTLCIVCVCWKTYNLYIFCWIDVERVDVCNMQIEKITKKGWYWWLRKRERDTTDAWKINFLK